MRLSGPFSLNVMRAFQGAVDLYYYKGIPVARKWPRTPTQPGTPDQKKTWTAIRTMHALIRNAPQQWRDTWKNTDLPVASTPQSLMRKCLLWALAKDKEIQIPEIQYIKFDYDDVADETTVTVQILGPPLYEGSRVSWRVGFPTGSHAARLKWSCAAFTRSREFHYKPAFHPDLDGYTVWPHQIWDSPLKQHRIRLPGNVSRVGLILAPL